MCVRVCMCVRACEYVRVCMCVLVYVRMYVSDVFPDAFKIYFQQGTLKLSYFHLQNIFGTLYLIFQLFYFTFPIFRI